jgi:predicted ATPase
MKKNFITINKKDLLVKETNSYILYENKNYNFTIENLAKSISKYLNTKFLLYRDREDNKIYTDNEYVLQILKYEKKLILKDLHLQDDSLINEKDEKLESKKYDFKVKWYYLYSVIYDMLFVYLKNVNFPDQNLQYGEKLYKLFNNDKDFVENNEWIKKFKKLKSIDPLHLYISFNYSNQKNENRKKRILIILNKLNSLYKNQHLNKLIDDIERYDIDFDGCPMPMAASILSARNKQDQKIIIENFFNFESGNDIDFSKIKNVYGVDIASLTIFMFWCKPLKYISLDKNNYMLLEKNNKIQKLPKLYKEYTKLLNGDNKMLYVNISKIAIGLKKIEDFNKYEQIEIKEYIYNFEESNFEFEIIALKILEDSNRKYYKNLLQDHYYIFNKNYKIENNKIINNQKQKINNLYSSENFKVSINAIVGKNGSGKSTIAEVLYGFIYNLSIMLKATTEMSSKKKIDLFVELIYRNDKIYKIILTQSEFQVYSFQEDKKEWMDITNTFNLNNFFYTISVNYSIYANNSSLLGNWIDTIFHKNDAYQTPIVIEPYRNQGNIDINRQLELAKQRLLINLLKPVNDLENSIRKLRDTKDYSIASKVKLTFNNKKIIENEERKISDELIFQNEKNNIFIKYGDIKNIEEINTTVADKFQLKNFKIEFDINKNLNDISLIGKVQLYILKKIVTIVNRYEAYAEFRNLEDIKLKDIKVLVEKLLNDPSHITFKLKRAIYFLKYDLLEKKEIIEFDINEHSEKIDEFRANQKDLLLHQITPPSFYGIDIFLGDNNDYINFNELSSGEKQRILGVNSLIYHLENLNYSSKNQKLRYKYVNIILDEIELYYHPQFQIEHIKYLLQNIEKADLDNIFGINFIFITHSPFILTDIVENNILFLSNKEEKTDIIFNTFGANIYDIFEKGFFLENSIGKVSEEWIKAIDLILSFYNAYHLAKEKNRNFFPLRNLLKKWYVSKNEELSEEEIKKQDEELLSKSKEKLLKDLFEKKGLEYEKFKFLIDDEYNLKSEIENYIKIIGDEVIRNYLDNLYESIKK